MFKIKQKTKKIFSTILIAGLIFVEISPIIVSAATVNVPDDAPKDPSGKPINSGDKSGGGMQNKDSGPKVEVQFTLTGNKKTGSVMTATAVPSFFNNSSNPKELYFTWYLKKSGCGLNNDAGDNNDCDLDGDKKITVNDWKIEAAKIIVAGSFDANETDKDGNKIVQYNSADYDAKMAKSSGFKAKPSPITTTDDKENQIWAINAGEDHNHIDAPNCYVQEPVSGLIYEMRRVEPVYTDCPDDAAGNHYHRACVSDQVAKCDVLNPDYTKAKAAARQNEIDAAIAWNAAHPDDLHVVPEPILKTIPNDFGVCAVASEADDAFKCDITNLENFETAQGCKNFGEVAMCVRDDGYTKFPISATNPIESTSNTNPLLAIIFGKDALGNDLIKSIDQAVNESVCSSFAKPNENTGDLKIDPVTGKPKFLDNTQPAISAADLKCETIKNKMINGTKDAEGNIVKAGSPKFDPTCTFEKSVNMCKHLFPVLPKDVKGTDGKRAISGDGDFSLDEKKFWGADPTKVSTTGGKGTDEQKVIGLGVDQFKWMYSVGDKVGVVVEGDSADPTKHADASFKRMWAFSNNTCKALEKLGKAKLASSTESSEDKRGMYTEGKGNAMTGFLTAEIDLDKCLEENLLSPETENDTGLKVEVNTSPANPVNDPSGNNGDILQASSAPKNIDDPSNLLYKWSLQISKDGSKAPTDKTSWIDITTRAIDNNSFTETEAEGLGKKDFDINLNFPENLITDAIGDKNKFKGTFYLKVRVTISSMGSDGNQTSQGFEIVRVKMQENEILVYPVTVSDAGAMSLNKGDDSLSMEMCSDPNGKDTCLVAANEILGLEISSVGEKNKLSNVSWKINNTEIACKSDCTVGGNKIFVPILGNIGEAVDVEAKAKNEKNELVELSRHFVITTPQLRIESMDGNAWPKLLGYYRDINNNVSCVNGGVGCQADLSTQVLETNEGSTVTLGTYGQSGFQWTIDGQIMPEYDNQNQIQLQINKFVGESYNIGLVKTALPSESNQTRNMQKALYKNWSIMPVDAPEESKSANIQLNVVANSGQTVATAKASFFGASLITHLPERLIFLLKISLVSFGLLFATSVIFAFMPERVAREE